MEQTEVLESAPALDETSPFENLFRSEYPSVHRAALRLVGENGRAEEIAAEVFVKLLARPALLRSQNLAGWLHRAAINAALDDLRKRRTSRVIVPMPGSDQTDANPYEVLERSERAAQVRAVLAKMGRRDVRLLVAKSLGFDYERMAQVAGVKKSSVGTLLARA